MRIDQADDDMDGNPRNPAIDYVPLGVAAGFGLIPTSAVAPAVK
jgi:hypothetical protein